MKRIHFALQILTKDFKPSTLWIWHDHQNNKSHTKGIEMKKSFQMENIGYFPVDTVDKAVCQGPGIALLLWYKLLPDQPK